MPFISIRTAQKLSDETKKKLKARMGEKISLLPNKSEAVLMVEIIDGNSVYFAGEQLEKGAFVDVRLYRPSPYEAKKLFAESVFDALEELTETPRAGIYLNFVEMDTWGSGLKGFL